MVIVAFKRALIVDDSKSARVVLSRMLQKYNIEVDTAESAENAIDYLVQNRPDVIFMDHLMPGMDGFQAVQAIKNNPRTATIPIMMYTSQEGELYVGQARALGAVGVLPKLVKPVDVSKVLYQLHLLPERRDTAPPAFIAANDAAAEATGEVRDTTKPPPNLLPADWHAQLESALRNHDAELRRFVVASLDTFSDRVVGDVRNLITETPALQTPPPPPVVRPPYLWIAAVAVALIPGIVLAVFYSRLLDSNRAIITERDRLATSNGELQATITQLNELNAMRAANPVYDVAPGATDATGGVVDGSLRRVESVPFGEVPLSGARLEALREMIADLQAQGFKGALRIESFTGRFCLAGNATEGFAVAPAELAAAKCDLIGNPFEDGLKPAQRQSLAFANLADSTPQRTEGAITVTTGIGGDTPIERYPLTTSVGTAGEWNVIAGRNNRVEFTAVANPPEQ